MNLHQCLSTAHRSHYLRTFLRQSTPCTPTYTSSGNNFAQNLLHCKLNKLLTDYCKDSGDKLLLDSVNLRELFTHVPK